MNDENELPVGSLEVADGTGISTEPITDAQINTDALSTSANPMSFQDGNLAQFIQESQSRTKLIQQTLVPLVDVALIELLGNSNNFRKSSGTITCDDSGCVVKLVYTVDTWIVSDVGQEAISHDAQYVYDRIKVISGVKSWKQCAINVQEGTLTVECLV